VAKFPLGRPSHERRTQLRLPYSQICAPSTHGVADGDKTLLVVRLLVKAKTRAANLPAASNFE
jgi:hypothetical protein